ncbi:hypothetical protein B0H14DRAFT_2608052 [Mycena olivaceomarginata]|nr:hypothetical protein B0H14DRAFT_2608052 [Mycena olivaceomarginata]
MSHSRPSSNSSSALIRHPETPSGPLSRRTGPLAISYVGRTMDKIISTAALRLGTFANCVAYQLGRGPAAVSERIQKHFGDAEKREFTIDSLRMETPPELLENCVKLMEYARR